MRFKVGDKVIAGDGDYSFSSALKGIQGEVVGNGYRTGTVRVCYVRFENASCWIPEESLVAAGETPDVNRQDESCSSACDGCKPGECEKFPTELSVAPTGAVRSKDADNVRYDLITPIGLRVVRAEACAWSYLVVMRKKQLSPCRLADEARSNLYESLSGIPSDEFKKRLSHAFMELAWADKMARSGFNAADVIAHLDDARNVEIPSTAYDAVARACHEGSIKYGEWNWERGFSVGSLLNHALKHISDWLSGDNTEDHLGHAMWNVLAAIHSYILWPHLNAGKLREPGCKPPQNEVTA